MKGLTYFAALAVLAAAMIFAQSPSSSGNPAQQTQSSTPGTSNSSQYRNQATQDSVPYDAQNVPHSSVDSSTTPQQPVMSTPAQRAVATHTPDPGTCMNPSSFDNGQDANGAAVTPHPAPGCQ